LPRPEIALNHRWIEAKFIAGVNAQQRQAECVFDAIRLKVPEGATVYVTDPLSESL
jgi:hypothetical protein